MVGKRIFDFLKNAQVFMSHNLSILSLMMNVIKKCILENNQDSIKTVKELKEEIPELKGYM